MTKINIKLKTCCVFLWSNRMYWFPVFVFILGVLSAFILFPNIKSTPFKPVLAVEGLVAPVYRFFDEIIDGQSVPIYLIDNPGESSDYKWQFRLDGVFVLIDRQDEKGWQVLAENISAVPEYFSVDDNVWMAYEKIGTSSVFLKKDGDKGEIIIERNLEFRGSTPVATGVEPLNSETLTETWRIPTTPDNQKLKVPKADFVMSKNHENLWRLKWQFFGLAGIEKDNIDIKDENGWPIRSNKYSDGEFVIDVDDFDNIANDAGAFSFSEYVGDGFQRLNRCSDSGSTAENRDRCGSGIVEIVFYPEGTNSDRTIDPVIAATGVATGWTDSKQRTVFHNGEYFFLFYTDGAGNLYYRTATSSIWSATSTLVTDISTTDPAFDMYVVDDATFDLAYISNSSANVYVGTCTTSAATISCGATSTPFSAASSVAIARTGTNRIWAAGRGMDNTLKIYSADFYGSATSGTTWLGEATSTETDLSGEITLAPYVDNDKTIAAYPVNKTGSSDDELKSTTIMRGAGFTASSTLTDWNSADIDISGLVWVSDEDFRLLARDNAAATGTAEFMYATSSNWILQDANIDVGEELDGTNPALSYSIDTSTGTLYAFLIDSSSGDLEMYQRTLSGAWGTESVVNGAETGTRSLPIVPAREAPQIAMRHSPKELPFAYRVANSAVYDFYVGSVGLSPKMSSADNQVFANGQANTSISAITIINSSSSTMITAASDIRIRIATSSAVMEWFTADGKANITGTASNKVSANVSFEGSHTMVIDVLSDFAPWDSITVSELSFSNFSYANPPNTGVLRLYLNGASDLVEESRDLSSVAIYGQLAFSDHTMGQIENQWSALSATSSTYHYRFKATPTGEDVNIGTTTFALSGISGVSTADIVSAKLYYDGNGNGNMAENDWANSGHVTYNGGGTSLDYAYDIAIDSDNNIYVVGEIGTNCYDWFIRKYNANGTLDSSWGSSGIVTYNSGGTQCDSAKSIVVDNHNNIYVAGTHQVNGYDWAIRKYNSAGALDTSWGLSGMITYNSGGGLSDKVYDIAIDNQNSIYITGYQSTNGLDMVVRKYSSKGILDINWGSSGMIIFNSGESTSDIAYNLLIDDINNLYVAGQIPLNGSDLVVRKYTQAGVLDTTWGSSGMVTFNSGATQADGVSGMVIDKQNNIYVAGFQGTNGRDFLALKYNINGILDTNWGDSGVVTYNSGGSQNDYVDAIAIDNSNNIYLAGMQATTVGDWLVQKYTSSGILDTSWGSSGSVTYSSGANLDRIYSIQLDSQRNIYAAGYLGINNTDWAIRKYDPSGQIDIYRDTFFMQGAVDISGNSGTIVFATSAPYKVTKATDFLLELTVSNIAAGDSMTVDYSIASSTGVRSGLAITPTGDPSAVTHRWGAEISSAANQTFALGQATTSISDITITDRGGIITATNNIRVKISTTTSYFLWDTTDTTASISGGASGKVSTTVSYEQGGAVLLIDVTSDFSSGDTITVSGLSFASFNKIGKLGQGALQLYLDGDSDTSQDGKDDKTIAITGAVSAGEHTLAQSTNQWSALSTTADGTHYRFRLTSTGDTTEMQNALFDFSGITGIVGSDISNAFLYADMNHDGYYGYSIPEAWYLGYNGAQERIQSLVVDTVNDVVYAGQGSGTGDGDIFYCRPNIDGDANGICENGEFTKSFEGAQEYIWTMAIDTRSGTIYAGQGSGTGDGDIYKCNPNLDGDRDGVCETTGSEWVKSYEGSEEYIYALAYDNDNSVMYASQGLGTTDGNIYFCAPYEFGDRDGICETGEWYGSFNGEQEGIYALVYDSYYNVMYAGQGSGAGDGDIYYCRPNDDGDADGICEYDEWTKSWEGAQEYVISMTIDNVNNVIYFGQGSGSGDGDVYYCKPGASGDADGLCETGEWTLSNNSTSWEFAYSLVFDPGQKAIYAGGASGSGDGDIYRCLPNTDGDANGICESGEWSLVFNGSQEQITALAVDSTNSVVYAGQANGTGDGDIYYFSTGDYQVGVTSLADISGSIGTLSFSTTSPWYLSGAVDYIIQLNGANIASGDALTIDWNSASTTGISTAGTALVSGNPASATHRIAVTLGTAADQAFAYNGASTAMSPLTITDVSGIITSANDIRITIATTSVNMRWDSADTTASISGTASGKVSGTVSYADGDATLVIDVTSDFSAGEAITVSDLNFKSFNTVNYPYQAGLELYLSGAGVRNQDGRNTNTIAVHGTAAVSNHALGSMTNTWHALNENMSEFLYRYRVTPTGETLNLGTTTISLPSFKGISADDISDVVLYYDANGDGALTDGAWGDGGSGMITYNSELSDVAYSIAIDTQNNIYVAGYQGSNGNDWAIRKYKANGTLDTDWGTIGMVTYNSGASQSDVAKAIVIDSENNIYVAGTTQISSSDIAVRKYTSAGILDSTWGNSGMVIYNSGALQSDSVEAIVIDDQNNIYIGGYLYNNSNDWFARKYNPLGLLDTSWGINGMVVYDSGDSQQDFVWDLAVDRQNNLYVAGFIGINGTDFAVRKYNTKGMLDVNWGSVGMVTFNSGASQSDFARKIVLDSQNNFFVVGSQNTNDFDWLIVKYTSAGVLDDSWGSAGIVTYNYQMSDNAWSAVLDSDNNLVVAGTFSNGVTDYMAIRKYDIYGVLDSTWGNSGMVIYNADSITRGVAIDKMNNIYLIGEINTNSKDWAIRKYDAYGNFGTYTDGPAANGAAIEIADGAGTITLATSSTYRISQSTDFLLKMTLSDVEQAEELKIDFSDLAGTGYTSDTDFTWSGDPGFSLFYKPEFSIEGDVMFEGTAVFE